MLKLIHIFNNKNIKILKITPGFKIFINNKFIGDIFVYDLNSENKFVKSFQWIKYDINDLFPSKFILFEDFYINIPNKIQNVLKINYPKSNLLECIDNPVGKELHSINNYYFFKFLSILENLVLKIPIIGYLFYFIVNIFISLAMKKAYKWF